MNSLTRRSFAQLLGVAALPLIEGPASAAPHRALHFSTAEEELNAWLKVYISVGKARVWYWYTGVIDAWIPGGPIVPLFAVDTLIRRDVTPMGASRYRIDMFEGSYFHLVGDPAPLDLWTNPLNGRNVHAFHYREGPYRFGYDAKGPFDLKTNAAYPGAPPFITRWHQAGDQLWFSRDNYIDEPHPFPMAEWPMESSGPRQQVGSFATHWASHAEVFDPRVRTARSAFHYEAFMDWLPWMLMGQAPGRMVWRGAGTKLGSIADLPVEARAGFMATHPRLFADEPWTDFANMAIDYKKLRKPAGR